MLGASAANHFFEAQVAEVMIIHEHSEGSWAVFEVVHGQTASMPVMRSRYCSISTGRAYCRSGRMACVVVWPVGSRRSSRGMPASSWVTIQVLLRRLALGRTRHGWSLMKVCRMRADIRAGETRGRWAADPVADGEFQSLRPLVKNGDAAGLRAADVDEEVAPVVVEVFDVCGHQLLSGEAGAAGKAQECAGIAPTEVGALVAGPAVQDSDVAGRVGGDASGLTGGRQTVDNRSKECLCDGRQLARGVEAVLSTVRSQAVVEVAVNVRVRENAVSDRFGAGAGPYHVADRPVIVISRRVFTWVRGRTERTAWMTSSRTTSQPGPAEIGE